MKKQRQNKLLKMKKIRAKQMITFSKSKVLPQERKEFKKQRKKQTSRWTKHLAVLWSLSLKKWLQRNLQRNLKRS